MPSDAELAEKELELAHVQEDLLRLQRDFDTLEEQNKILSAKNKAYRRIALYLLSSIELKENREYQAVRARAELEELL